MLVRQVLNDCSVLVNLHIARHGEQAISMLADAQFKPALIILDLNIPRISGLALLERREFGKTPVVVFTSSSNPAEKERCIALGVREVVLKPMDLGEFSETVCRIVRTWAIPEATCARS